MQLNTQQQRQICALLAIGGTRQMAAEYAGCQLADITQEIADNPVFAEQLTQSELRPEVEILRALLQAARDPKQWRAAAWALERMYPERYAQRKGDAISGKDLRHFVNRLVQVLKQEMPNVEHRERILKQVLSAVE